MITRLFCLNRTLINKIGYYFNCIYIIFLIILSFKVLSSSFKLKLNKNSLTFMNQFRNTLCNLLIRLMFFVTETRYQMGPWCTSTTTFSVWGDSPLCTWVQNQLSLYLKLVPDPHCTSMSSHLGTTRTMLKKNEAKMSYNCKIVKKQ